MIKKLLNLINIGTPKVDLILQNTNIKPGDKITGYFELKGGWVTHKMSRLECDFIREYPGGKPEIIEPVKTLLLSKTLEINSKTEVPFTYQLPLDLNLSAADDVTYRFRTKLVLIDDIKSMDHDKITIIN